MFHNDITAVCFSLCILQIKVLAATRAVQVSKVLSNHVASNLTRRSLFPLLNHMASKSYLEGLTFESQNLKRTT